VDPFIFSCMRSTPSPTLFCVPALLPSSQRLEWLPVGMAPHATSLPPRGFQGQGACALPGHPSATVRGDAPAKGAAQAAGLRAQHEAQPSSRPPFFALCVLARLALLPTPLKLLLLLLRADGGAAGGSGRHAVGADPGPSRHRQDAHHPQPAVRGHAQRAEGLPGAHAGACVTECVCACECTCALVRVCTHVCMRNLCASVCTGAGCVGHAYIAQTGSLELRCMRACVHARFWWSCKVFLELMQAPVRVWVWVCVHACAHLFAGVCVCMCVCASACFQACMRTCACAPSPLQPALPSTLSLTRRRLLARTAWAKRRRRERTPGAVRRAVPAP